MIDIINVFRCTVYVILLATFNTLAAQIPQWQWARSVNTNDDAKAISIDPAGNIYITGYFGAGTSHFSGTSPHTVPSTLSNTSDDDI